MSTATILKVWHINTNFEHLDMPENNNFVMNEGSLVDNWNTKKLIVFQLSTREPSFIS